MNLKDRLEPVSIAFATYLKESLNPDGDTPLDIQLSVCEELLTDVKKDLGDSLLGRMMTAMCEWQIDQIKLEMRVFN